MASDITSILMQAQSGDAAVRKPAEDKLRAAEEANFPAYIVLLADEMQNAAKHPQSRYLAGILIKNSLTARSDTLVAHVRQRWIAMDPAIKSRVKQTCLSCLAAQVVEVRRIAAQIVARIGVVELPRREWAELVPALCSAMTHKADDGLRVATLQTLGYICEEIDEGSITEHTNQILTAVVQGMTPDERNDEVKLAAVSALNFSVDFIRHVFESQNERDYLMRMVLECTRSTAASVRCKAFETLNHIAAVYYDKLAPYMQAIFNVTVPLIKAGSDREEVVLQAIEFWSSLAEIEFFLAEEANAAEEEGKTVPEAEQSKRFVHGALHYLADALTATLLKQEEDQDDDVWNPSLAGATCLSLVAECVHDDIMASVMPFVTANISSTEWRAREAATIAFGSILQGPRGIGQIISGQGALTVLLSHMADQVELVRDSTAWAIGRICLLHHTAIVATPESLQGVLAALVQGLKQDIPRVAANCAWAINNLAESLSNASNKQPPDTTVLSPAFYGLLTELLAAAERADCDAKLRSAAYTTLNTLVHRASRDCYGYVSQLASVCADRLDRLILGQGQEDASRKEREEAQALVCAVINECITKLHAQVVPALDRIFALYMKLYTQGAGPAAQEEAVVGFGYLATATESQFARLLPQLFPVLQACLRNAAEYEVCNVAVGAVGDIARTLGNAFVPYARDILALLLANLQNASLDRSTKPPILSCVGDIAMAIGADFLPYLQPTMSMLGQAALVRVDPSDEDQVEYLNQLRESIFEAFTGILQGMRAANQSQALLPHAASVLEAIRLIFADSSRSETLSRGIAGAIGDLAHALGPAMKPLLAHGQAGANLIAVVTEIEQGADSQTTTDVAHWALELLQSIARS